MEKKEGVSSIFTCFLKGNHFFFTEEEISSLIAKAIKEKTLKEKRRINRICSLFEKVEDFSKGE